MIAVGIDIASRKHDYFMIQSETGLTFKRSSVTIENNESGYKKTPRGHSGLQWSYR